MFSPFNSPNDPLTQGGKKRTVATTFQLRKLRLRKVRLAAPGGLRRGERASEQIKSWVFFSVRYNGRNKEENKVKIGTRII